MNTAAIGLSIPFLGTSLGAALVFFLRDKLKPSVEKMLTGFAGGVMIAASIWSLIIPAIHQSESMGRLSFIPAVVGFWAGILFLLLLDHLIPHLHNQAKHPEGPHSHLKRTTMLLLAVTLHNIPEAFPKVQSFRFLSKHPVLNLRRLFILESFRALWSLLPAPLPCSRHP